MSTSPESLIDLVFAKCSLVYGRDFLARWEGLDIAEVKADWQRELTSVLRAPNLIRYALERLPADKPPNVLQFRALCTGKQAETVLALPEPPVPPEKKAAVRAMLSRARINITRGVS